MTKLQDFLNSPVPAVTRMGRGAKQGDVFGLELECEGRNVDFDGSDAGVDLMKDWAPHHDGSLRANHGSCCEWVFNGPVKYEKCVDRVEKLFKYFEGRKAKLVCSNRTSFHVHFNMGDKSAYQLVNLFILFTILEDILDAYCGEDRKGNLFCLSSRHAEEQVNWVMEAVFKHQSFGNLREDQRYCSLNMASINKFGTVEFRAMRGLDNKTDVLAWLDILNEFCQYACYTMKNPATLIEDISVKTPKGFLREVFSRKSYEALTANLSDDLISGSIYEGLRMVQMLCYRVGTEFDQVRLRGRDFWASFAGDEEPALDVDPALLAAQRGRPAARGNRVRQAPQPAFFNPEGMVNVPNPGDAFAQAVGAIRQAEDEARRQRNMEEAQEARRQLLQNMGRPDPRRNRPAFHREEEALMLLREEFDEED